MTFNRFQPKQMRPDNGNHMGKVDQASPLRTQDSIQHGSKSRQQEEYSQHQSSSGDSPLYPDRNGHGNQRDHCNPDQTANQYGSGHPEVLPQPAMALKLSLHKEQQQSWNPGGAGEQSGKNRNLAEEIFRP